MPFALLGPTTLAEENPSAPSEPVWDFVEFQVKSWGEPLSSWRLTSRGGGSWTETQKGESDPNGTYSLAWHEIPEDVTLYVSLEEILRSLPAPAPDPDDCEVFMPDLPYGTLRMTKGATTTEIKWNSGCMDPEYRSFMEILKKADTLISTVGRDQPIQRTETFP